MPKSKAFKAVASAVWSFRTKPKAVVQLPMDNLSGTCMDRIDSVDLAIVDESGVDPRKEAVIIGLVSALSDRDERSLINWNIPSRAKDLYANLLDCATTAEAITLVDKTEETDELIGALSHAMKSLPSPLINTPSDLPADTNVDYKQPVLNACLNLLLEKAESKESLFRLSESFAPLLFEPCDESAVLFLYNLLQDRSAGAFDEPRVETNDKAFYAVVTQSYKKKNDFDIDLEVGVLMKVTKCYNDGWWYGINGSNKGEFPGDFCIVDTLDNHNSKRLICEQLLSNQDCLEELYKILSYRSND